MFCHASGINFLEHAVGPDLSWLNFSRNVKNEIALICAKFCADLVKTSKVTSRKTKRTYRPITNNEQPNINARRTSSYIGRYQNTMFVARILENLDTVY